MRTVSALIAGDNPPLLQVSLLLRTVYNFLICVFIPNATNDKPVFDRYYTCYLSAWDNYSRVAKYPVGELLTALQQNGVDDYNNYSNEVVFNITARERQWNRSIAIGMGRVDTRIKWPLLPSNGSSEVE